MGDNCTGSQGQTAFNNDWISGACSQKYSAQIFPTPGQLNQDGLNGVKNSMNLAISTLLRNQGGIREDQGTGTVQESILDFCRSQPAACTDKLGLVCSIYTDQDMLSKKKLLSFCGCYLTQNSFVPPSVPPECLPTCTPVEVVHLPTDSANIKYCQKDVCVISDVTVNAVNSSVGNITFDQYCSSCTGGSCLCIVNDISTGSIASNFISQCSETNCFDDNGATIQCPTSPSNNPSDPSSPTEESFFKKYLLYIVIGGIFFMLLAIAILVILLRKPSEQNYILPKSSTVFK
jgi:hypothetical protein